MVGKRASRSLRNIWKAIFGLEGPSPPMSQPSDTSPPKEHGVPESWADPSPPEEHGVPQSWAVLIGIEYYGKPEEQTTPRYDMQGNRLEYPTLNGCINDILAVEDFLVNTKRVEPTHITKLLAPAPNRKLDGSSRSPTYHNIINALKVPKGARKGDSVYIHFSGHGAVASTLFAGLKTPDDHDEALVPSDVLFGGKYLRDLEMGALLEDMVSFGLLVTVVLDCCHSGGAVRGTAEPGTRGISGVYRSNRELDVPGSADRIEKLASQRSWMHEPQGFVVLAACERHRKAHEIHVPGKTPEEKGMHFGLVTHALLSTLRNNPVDATAHELYDQICAKVQHHRDQTPDLIGDKDRFFFGAQTRTRGHHHLLVKRAMNMRKAPEDQVVVLTGGKLHGVKKMSRYVILPLGFDPSGRYEEADVLARVQVTAVRATESDGLFTLIGEHWGRITTGCPAVLQGLPKGVRSAVCFDVVDEEQRANMTDAWDQCTAENNAWLLLDNERGKDASSFIVSVEDDGTFAIHDKLNRFTPAIGCAASPLAATPANMPALIRRLEHLAKFKTIQQLASPKALSALVSVTVQEPSSDELDERTPAKIEYKDGIHMLDDNTVFGLSIRNESGRDLKCVVLDCGAELGISQLFPCRSVFHALEPDQTRLAHFQVRIAEELRSAARDTVFTDTFKVFAYTGQANLGSLQLPSLKQMEDMWETSRGGAGEEALEGELEALLSMVDDGREGMLVEPGRREWEIVDIQIGFRKLQR